MIYHLKNVSNDYLLLLQYLQEIDNDFEISFSQKVNLEEYVSKLLQNGYVYTVIDENKRNILACVGFYCNDMNTHIAYLSLLSTRMQARGKGYAKLLVNTMVECCKKRGMYKIFCDSVNPIAVKLYKSCGFIQYKIESCERLTKTFLKLDLL